MRENFLPVCKVSLVRPPVGHVAGVAIAKLRYSLFIHLGRGVGQEYYPNCTTHHQQVADKKCPEKPPEEKFAYPAELSRRAHHIKKDERVDAPTLTSPLNAKCKF